MGRRGTLLEEAAAQQHLYANGRESALAAARSLESSELAMDRMGGHMDEVTALKLIDTLANGVNPVTGELLAPDSPCQQPDVVRALCLAARALDERRQRSERQRGLPANVGKSWTSAEDEALIAEFHAGKKLGELAVLHQRTQTGIQARLEKLGLVEPVTGGNGGAGGLRRAART
jgi:hypothetical protein